MKKAPFCELFGRTWYLSGHRFKNLNATHYILQPMVPIYVTLTNSSPRGGNEKCPWVQYRRIAVPSIYQIKCGMHLRVIVMFGQGNDNHFWNIQSAYNTSKNGFLVEDYVVMAYGCVKYYRHRVEFLFRKGTVCLLILNNERFVNIIET